MADTNTQATEAVAQASGGAGQALYDSIMAEIEPELTSAQVSTLAEKYKEETPDEATVRGERYAKAFEEFNKRLAAFQGDMNAEMNVGMREAFASVERDDRTKESNAMDDLESAINNA